MKVSLTNRFLLSLVGILAAGATQAQTAPQAPVTLEAEAMTTKTNGGLWGPTNWGLYSNGYVENQVSFPVSGTYQFRVTGFSTLAAGVGGEAEIRIDGVARSARQIFQNTSLGTLTFQASVTAGVRRVAVAFTNDAIINGQDRNLILDKVAIVNPTSTPAPTCSYPNWVQGQYYAAGSIVKYTDGKFYVAKYANPGYNPTISTYYWAPYTCTTTSTTTTTTSTTTTMAPVTTTTTTMPSPITSDPFSLMTQRNCTFAGMTLSSPTMLRSTHRYWTENNMWGVNNWSNMGWYIQPIAPLAAGWRYSDPNQANKFHQCVGMSTVRADGSISAVLRWDYPRPAPSWAPNEVKGYPQLIVGQKPGYQTTPGSNLPVSVAALLNGSRTVTSSWSTEIPASTYTQSKGHLSYDIWLSSYPNATTGFDNGDKTHEIMITLDAFDGYGRTRWDGFFNFHGTFTISGAQYRLYTAKQNFGSSDPWRFVVFQSVTERRPTGSINMREFLQVMRNVGIASGNEHLVSMELGVEPENGAGQVYLKSFKVDSY